MMDTYLIESLSEKDGSADESSEKIELECLAIHREIVCAVRNRRNEDFSRCLANIFAKFSDNPEFMLKILPTELKKTTCE